MRKKTKEEERLNLDPKAPLSPWRKWGAYLSERSWGTVREDNSQDGNAWTYLTHDMARSKAYRWGEDGLAGLSDYFQTLVFHFAFWNGKDPILKERLFGLTPYEGNHGEDVKECYYYLDATPTQSYLKYLYKYPQAMFPYDQLVYENQKRSPKEREFELEDTQVFADGNYFDLFIEYAKEDTEDICIRLEAWNRGKNKAVLHVLPHLFFRNRWSWDDPIGPIPKINSKRGGEFVTLCADPTGTPHPKRASFAYDCPVMYLYGPPPREVLFTENETHNERVFGPNIPSRSPYVKDAFHRYLIQKESCLTPTEVGSKSALHYEMEIEGGEKQVLLLRLTSKELSAPLANVESLIALRRQEADEFYNAWQNPLLSQEDKAIQRAALAGMIWSQQLYIYDVKTWLESNPAQFPRNERWSHLYACDVISMPDKWEYPWFAAWDLAFHAVTLSLVSLTLAKEQLLLLLKHWYQHVNGQIPAYEWSFSDLNPPIQAWSLWKVYLREKEESGKGDRQFLLFGFLRLSQNFSWWVNKVDRLGNNVFEGGFLGLDNISVIDRSTALPNGGIIEQSDATGWMGLYSLTMMRIALELAKDEPVYQSLATTFFENFVYISDSMHEVKGLWDEEDGFFYDVLLHPDRKIEPLKIRSFVGIIPFYSFLHLEEEELRSYPEFYDRLLQFQEHNPQKVRRCFFSAGTKRVFSLMDMTQVRRMFMRVFDPEEFLSDYGLRSLSRYYATHPMDFGSSSVQYEPGESLEKIKGGNSNWRGPIWLATNYLFLDTLHKLAECYGFEYMVETPLGLRPLGGLHTELKERLCSLFRKNLSGYRAIHGDASLYKEDPFFQDLLLFYEHYHGETGRGLGASHQTGWSGLIANILHQSCL